MLRTKNNHRSGTTLIELMVAVSLLTVVMGAIASVATSGTGMFRTGVTRTTLESEARRALGRIQQELLASDHSSLDAFPVAPLWDSQLVFDQPASMAVRDGWIEWETARIELRMDTEELDDGIDNDGDGLVDEGKVVLVKDWTGPSEKTVVLCNSVSEYARGETPNGLDDNGNGLIDERGLCFDMRDGNLFFLLTVERLDPDGHLLARSFRSSVWLRN